jgi:hypothetical protein
MFFNNHKPPSWHFWLPSPLNTTLLLSNHPICTSTPHSAGRYPNTFYLAIGRTTKGLYFCWQNNLNFSEKKFNFPWVENALNIIDSPKFPHHNKTTKFRNTMPNKISKYRALVELWNCYGGGTRVKARGLKNRNPFKQRPVNRPLPSRYITAGRCESLQIIWVNFVFKIKWTTIGKLCNPRRNTQVLPRHSLLTTCNTVSRCTANIN